MTKNDYNIIAETFSVNIYFAVNKEKRALQGMAESLATKLEKNNKNFNREKFIIACNTVKPYSE